MQNYDDVSNRSKYNHDVIQRSFFKSKSKYSKTRIAYGGVTKGLSKDFRPLDSRKPLHVIFKSKQAKGPLSLLGFNKLKVDQLITQWGSKTGITIHRKENMGNHLHLIVSFPDRRAIQKFLRTVSGLIARVVTKAKKGRPFGTRFWDELVFTRIVTGERDRRALDHYFDKNAVERDAGPALRKAMEDYDDITKQARRRKISREQIYVEIMERFNKNQR